jgi:hypothetical protein
MPITPQQALLRCINHQEILHDDMVSLFRSIMQGEMAPTLMAGLLMALRVKQESVGEITAAAQVMREFSTKVEVADTQNLLDIVGTGGDGAHTFNISTASMFVAAAAGARVAKHGGRSVSSSSGSADILEACGANINLTPKQVAQAIEQTGIGFMFAPQASRMSALPEEEETLRPPCLATRAPAAAATNMEAVEILKVCAPSPPVPTISSRFCVSATSTLVENSRITCAAAVISPTLSCLTRKAINSPAISVGAISPCMMERNSDTMSSCKIS